ncbi:MAG: protein phosphatase 2C domain-containing protein [Actinomycetota bacterium]
MTETTQCPTCGETVPAGAAWCEACGADLNAEPPVACVSCGAFDITEDGYCGTCGHRQPGPRDRVETAVGRAVGVSDKGLRHHHNEDAVALGELIDGAVLVVCDGVSSTAGSAEASEAAALAAVASLTTTLVAGADDAAVAAALEDATMAAQDAAGATADGVSEAERAAARQHGPPSSTFLAAVAVERTDGLALGVAWLGDSRAYWIDDDGAELLTTDHEINGSLVRWLGADSGQVPPELFGRTVTGPGRLLLCTDGLWRYADPPGELHALVRRLTEEGGVDDAELARKLTAHAIDSGGHDNISVAIWSREPKGPVDEGPPDDEGVESSNE